MDDFHDLHQLQLVGNLIKIQMIRLSPRLLPKHNHLLILEISTEIKEAVKSPERDICSVIIFLNTPF